MAVIHKLSITIQKTAIPRLYEFLCYDMNFINHYVSRQKSEYDFDNNLPNIFQTKQESLGCTTWWTVAWSSWASSPWSTQCWCSPSWSMSSMSGVTCSSRIIRQEVDEKDNMGHSLLHPRLESGLLIVFKLVALAYSRVLILVPNVVIQSPSPDQTQFKDLKIWRVLGQKPGFHKLILCLPENGQKLPFSKSGFHFQELKLLYNY